MSDKTADETPTEPIEIEVVETGAEFDDADAISNSDAIAAEDAEKAEDRLFSVVAVGLMVLLLICVALVVIADRRPPAGL